MGLDIKLIDKVILQVPDDLNHISYLITSLQEFSVKFNVKVNFKKNLFKNVGRVEVDNKKLIVTKHEAKKIAILKVYLKNNKSILLGFDFNDSDSFFSLQALKQASYYFKRTYVRESVGLVQKEFPVVIDPLGIPFMLKPDIILNENKFKSIFICNRVLNKIKFSKNLFSILYKVLSKSREDWKTFKSTRTLSNFENQIESKKIDAIFYQKRFFPNENSEDTKSVHQQRIDIVRLLKKEFPDNFKGGIKDDENLPDKYKDCASTIDGSQSEFLKIVKKSGICIYTRGLSNSIGWTLPEFMSQGKAIVAEHQSVVFPKALEHNVHLLYFSNTDELKTHINYLLKHPEEIKRLSANARMYYENHISPKIYFETILKQIHA